MELELSAGLFVPWDGEAWGAPARFLPAPLDDLLVGSGRPVVLGRLAELDGQVRLPAVAAGLALLLAGVVQAARTPVDAPSGGRVRHPGAVGFAGRCALRLRVATALALPCRRC
ncbi:streptophobe family protein [Streptomyces pharetrae]|uniref:streptophobe family protein n=1 Tax=Streptomyces pharetrae TaxID=291370 RepID=UPI003661A4D9